MNKLFFILFVITLQYSIAQQTGQHAYSFLNLSNSARLTSLGGNMSSVFDGDISLVKTNPSLIHKSMHSGILLNYVDYFADIQFGHVTYSHTFEKYGSFAFGIQYVDYGTFTEADETGQTYGEFKAGDYAFIVGWGRELHPDFSIGANLKSIHSFYYENKSFALSVDVAGTYHNEEKFFSTSLVVKNIGRQIITYTDGVRESLPFEIQLSASKRLEHVPLRFHALFHNLQKYDITYNDPNVGPKIDPLTGEEITESKISDISNKLMHHVVFGVEFMPSKNFSVRLGYNYHRRKEMLVDTKLSTVGISWGFGFRVSKFQFSYARSAYHLAGSPNVITLTTAISDFVNTLD